MGIPIDSPEIPVRLALLLTLALAACESSTGPSRADVAGDYSLRTINGQPLPYTVGPGFTVLSQRLHLESGSSGSFAEQTSGDPTDPFTGQREVTWRIIGSDSLTVRYSPSTSFGGHVRADTITLRPEPTVALPDNLELYVHE